MSVTLNANGDVCAIQKAGGQGVIQSVVMQCLRIASVKAGDITSKIKTVVSIWYLRLNFKCLWYLSCANTSLWCCTRVDMTWVWYLLGTLTKMNREIQDNYNDF